MHISTVRSQAAAGAHGFPTSRNWYSWCQAFAGWIKTITDLGIEPTWYGSARAAWNASPPAVSMDPYAAPPGALHWFTAGHPDYDVKISLGRGRVAHAYRDQDYPWAGLINVGEDEWDSAAAKAPWMNTTYLGWTYGFGPGNAFMIDIQIEDPVPAGAKRFTNGDGTANQRSLPTTDSPTVDTGIAGNDYGDFKAWTRAQSVNGQDIWIQGYHSGLWSWIGSFTSQDVSGLPEVPDPRPAVVDPPTPAPTPYTFEAFHPVVSKVIPTVLLGRDTRDKAERGNFPARPAKVVIHDFGEVYKHTYESVINDFSNDNGREVSAHFVIGWDSANDRSQIVQMVALTDRAYHAGPNGNDFVGIEVDPLVNTATVEGARIRLDVASLLAALREHYGYDMVRIEHNQVLGAATQCGDDIELSWWEAVVEPPIPPVDPTPPTDPEQPGPVDPTDPTGPVEPEPEPPVVIVPDPNVPVTPEQEKAAAELAEQFVKGELLVGDAVLARIRTIVPLVMGPVLTFLLTRFPQIGEILDQLAPGWMELVYGGVAALLGFGWWSLARWLGKRWPIAEKLMLGSSKAPVYIDRVDRVEKDAEKGEGGAA